MSASPPVRVLLVDDSIVSLQGLKAVLSRSKRLTIVGTASSETEAMAAIEQYEPDVVVLDIQVRGASGINMCRVIHENYPKIAVFMFTAHDNKEALREAILAGAQGYLLKTASGEAIVKSLEIVSSGQAVMDQHLTSQVMEWVREIGDHPSSQSKVRWSHDDVQLLALIAQGNTNKEIAELLGVTRSVVSMRLQKIYRRLKISRRSEAASYFIQRGLSTSPEGQWSDQGEKVESKRPAEHRKHSGLPPDS